MNSLSTQAWNPTRPTLTDRFIQFGVIVCAAVVVFLGGSMLLGWVTQNENVVFSIPGAPLMVANTAFCALLIGVGVFTLSQEIMPPMLGRISGGIAGIVSCLTSFEWVFGVNIGIDQWLVKPFTEEGQVVAGRMSPHTANAMTMLGVAVVYISLCARRNWPLVVPAALAAVSMALAVAVLIGYMVGYLVPLANTMALQTAVSILMLCLAVFGLVHLRARARGIRVHWWLSGPMIAFAVACLLLVRFGYLTRSLPAGEANLVGIAEVITIGMTAFAVAATVASHLAASQFQARSVLQDLKGELQVSNEFLDQQVRERTNALERHRAHLRRLTHQLTLAEERERRRLSKEMHNYLAQMLVVARMHLTAAKSQVSGKEAVNEMDEISGILDQCLEYTRTLMAKLSPSILFDQGLVAALRWLAQGDHGRDLQVEVESNREEIPLNEEQTVFVYQSVRELLHNVAKHSDADRVRIEVMVSRKPANTLTVRVSDFGRGFDVEGWRKDTRAGKNGYGLFAIIERLEVLQGSMEVNSAPGQGTRIVFHLPLSETADGPVSQDSTETCGLIRGVSSRGDEGVRIVLVEDHKLVRDGLRILLEKECHMQVVAEAGDGEEALEVIRSVNPDIVLMDINMPRLSGIEATRILREVGNRTKIMALTMQDDESTRKAMRDAGANGFVSKSTIGSEICGQIQDVLAR